MSFFYYMYDLYFESFIRLYDSDALLCHTNNTDPDVIILESNHFLPETSKVGDYNTFYSTTRTWFKTEIGSFLVENGNRIYVAPAKSATTNDISSYIIGCCTSLIFLQREICSIHGSALSFNNGCVIISGSSGSGKSTTALSLVKQGFRYLSDDIVILSSDSDFTVRPGLPLQKFCRNIAESFEDKNALIHINEERDKYVFIDKKSFDPLPKKVFLLIILEPGESSDLECEEIYGFSKVEYLLNSIFLNPIFQSIPYPLKIKQECLKLAGNIRIIRIKRPLGSNTVDRICGLVKEYMEEICPQ